MAGLFVTLIAGRESRADNCTNGFARAPFPLECGMAVVTCYSGNTTNGVNTNGYVMGVVDLRDPAANSPGLGTNWCAPMFHNELAWQAPGFVSPTNIWSAANLGQVFGVKVDDANPPNIYVAATKVYGVSQLGFGGPGAVYKINGANGSVSLFVALTNNGPALGNLGYDSANKQIFVSNFEDGLIYRYSLAGVLQNTFDHGVNGRTNQALVAIPDDGAFGLPTPFGRRVFGLNVYNGRLYYSVWSEDGASPAINTTTNEIWSVALNGTGDFVPATAKLEISLPQYAPQYSNPVADINFSNAGRMILAERTFSGGYFGAFNAGAHYSRILEYQLSGPAWVPGNTFFIGEWILKNNSSGGADYNCDGQVIGTGDGVKLGNEISYGIAILPASGNTQLSVVTNSYIVDLNGVFGTQDKTQIGDVVVVKNCCQCLTITDEIINCVTNNQYSYTFTVTNLSSGPISWLAFPDLPTNVTVSPNLIPLSPPLPTGAGTTVTVTFGGAPLSLLTNLCFRLSGHTADFAECCAVTHCVSLPKCCASIVKEQVVCDPANPGVLNWSFSLLNQSGIPVSYVFLASLTNCATATPDIIHLQPPLPSGQATNFTVAINASNCGTNTCFLIALHDSNVVQCCSFQHCVPLNCKPNNNPPKVDCPGLITQCKTNSGPVNLTAFVFDADGDPLQVTWKVNSVAVHVDNVPGGSPTAANLTFSYPFTFGSYTVTICVTDGNSPPLICTTIVQIGDHTPPNIQCPTNIVIYGFQATIPSLVGSVVATDNCTPTNQLKFTQSPPAGTPVGPGTNCVTVTVTDAAGNAATCKTCIIVLPIGLVPDISLKNFTAPADLPLTVVVDQKLTSLVNYYASATLIGTARIAPFNFTWLAVPAGSYVLTAEAVGVNGARALSDPLFVVVSPSPSAVGGVTVRPNLFKPLVVGDTASFSLNTASGETCYIEYTDSLEPPNWQLLKTLVGDGNERTVSDTVTNRPQRFYRVRIQ
ncbi:MAG: HYR domain-containing protein [Verrucomicrobia bacterium]|nr:HYR domain-containing protein [Verrucomicrobiota bacterium]